MLRSKRESWQAPRRTNWNKVSWVLAAVTMLGLAAALVWTLTRPAPVAPPPPPPPPSAHSLSPLETAGLHQILGRYLGPSAYTMSGTITVGKNDFGVQLATISDQSAGTGTITAGGTHGEMLLEGSKVYLRGDSAFWSALGVTGAPPPGPGWVDVGPEFMDGKLFYPSERWTAELAPTPESVLDGNDYTSGTASAVLTTDGLAEITVPETLVARIGPADPAQVRKDADALIEARGEVVELGRSASGRWTLPAQPAPSEEATPTPTP